MWVKIPLQNLNVPCDFLSRVRLTLSGGVRSMLSVVFAYRCYRGEPRGNKETDKVTCMCVLVVIYVFMG